MLVQGLHSLKALLRHRVKDFSKHMLRCVTCMVEVCMEGRQKGASVMSRPQSCGCCCSMFLNALHHTGFSTSQLTR